MAFNLGAFAGGLAKGGVDTYLTLENIESQKKRDALVELQAQEARAAAEERTALKNAASNTYGQVGAPETALPGRKLSEAEVTNAYAIDQGDASAIPPKAYTQAQADADYLAKVRGINPEKALNVEGLQTQTAIGKSSLARIKAEDDFSVWMQDSQALAAKDPVGFLKANLGEYNNAKKGSHLDDGNTASVVASADGKSFSFVRTDSKGKLVDSTPINENTAAEALKHIAFSKYSALPGKFKESAELGLRKTEVDLKGREVTAKEKLLPSEIAKNEATAAQARAHAGVYNNLLTTAKENRAAGEAMKPFLDEFAQMTPEEQAGSKGQAVLLKGATAGAQKSKDLAGIVSMLRKPDRTAVSPERDKAAHAALNTAIETNDQKRIDFVKSQYPDVFGEDPMVKQVREALAAKAEAEKKNKAGTSEPPTTALPVTPAATVTPKPQTSALATVAAPLQQRLVELTPLIDKATAKVRAGGGLEAARELQTLTQERDKILANPVMK